MNNKFSLKLKLVVAILIFVTFVLILLNTFTTTHITKIEILKGSIQKASISDQQIRVHFSRPVIKDNITSFINIEPKVSFNTFWNGNVLVINFTESLNSLTEYRLSINKDLKDIYNANLELDTLYKFKTTTPEFAVIEKDVINNTNSISIFEVDLTKKETLITREKIKYYGINKNYLVIVTENSRGNNIEILNRLNRQITNLNLTNSRISGFDFSKSKFINEFAYIKQDVEFKEEYYIPKGESKVFIYNIDSNTQNEFNPQNTGIDVTDLHYSNDGESLIYKNNTSFYSLAEVNSPTEFNGLGKFLCFEDFSKISNSILFLDYSRLEQSDFYQYVNLFTADREVKQLTDGTIPVLDPVFKNKSDTIIYSQLNKPLELTKGMYKIMQMDLNGNSQDMLASNDFSLELPKLSSDDRYIAIEQYSKINLNDYTNVRSFGFQNKPNLANVIIFDTQEKKVINKNIIATDVIWIN